MGNPRLTVFASASVVIFLASTTLAQPLQNGGMVSAAILAPGEERTYAFSVSLGDSFLLSISGEIRLELLLYYPDGTYAGNTESAIWIHSTSTGGQYSVVVRSWYGTQLGEYDLHFFAAPGANEHGQLLESDMRSEIVTPGDIDSYTFSANAGNSVMLSVSGERRMEMRLYHPDGSHIITSDDTLWMHSIADSGMYTVMIKSWYPDQQGGYSLHFARTPGASEHGSLAASDHRTGSVTAGDLDTYTFPVSAGESILLSISGDRRMEMRLYYPDGTHAVSGDTEIWGHSLAESGLYTVIVKSWYAHQQGDYDLHFVRSPGANEHGSLSSTGIRSGTITRGDLDSYVFTATQNSQLYLNIDGTMRFRMRLYYPDGSYAVATDEWISSQSLSQSGVYTVVVASWYGHDVGDYEIYFEVEPYQYSYAALGDSYSSGEGVFPFLDLSLPFTSCNRSALAYATQVRLPFSPIPLSVSGNAEFDFYACTGALTENIPASGEGQYGEPPQATPTQVNGSRDLITITIGGNDAYFARILAYCMLHDHCHDLMPFDPYLGGELGDLFPLWVSVVKQRLRGVFQELKSSAPNSTIIALDYPLVVSGNECPQTEIPFDSGAYLSADEQAWMREANRALNQAIREAAAEIGIHFATVSERFEGHGVCGESDDWLYGTSHFWPQGWFHPNAKGQREYAKVVNAYLDSIKSEWPAGYYSSGLPRNPAPTGGDRGLPDPPLGGNFALPAFGELFVSLVAPQFGCDDSVQVVAPGEMVNLFGAGFAADEVISVSLRVGNQSLALGNYEVTSSGVLDVVAVIPNDAPHALRASIEALGGGPNSSGLLLLDVIEVATSFTADSDEDGVPNACDNCPDLSNPSQEDYDADGIGDLCDACPEEFENDEDGDGLCRSNDICPLDSENDIDEDGLCASEDNCAITFNPDQMDLDGDGIGDVCQSIPCHSVVGRASHGGAGEIVISPSNCGDNGYFEGSIVTMRAIPYAGQFFTGWTGTIGQQSAVIEITVSSDVSLVANFCSSDIDTDGDLIADVCDPCPFSDNSQGLDGDIDLDGNIDIDDVESLTAVLLDSPRLPAHVANSDLNCDGSVNGLDIQVFVQRLGS